MNQQSVVANPLNLPAKREFRTVDDVVRHFESNPHRLVSYIERADEMGNSVLAVHIQQLARLVDTGLVFAGRTLHAIPLAKSTFTSPNNFDNMHIILTRGREMFRL